MRRLFRFLVRLVALAAVSGALAGLVATAAFRLADPPLTYLMAREWLRLGAIERDWRDLDRISPHLARAVMAAEDARFCAHWGFDLIEIRKALAEADRRRGASTITQQTAKNVFLWPDASWTRKGLEAGFALLIEALWPKRRILEIYLNVAEMGTGVFGAEAAARRWFGVSAADLGLAQAARIAAILPDPRGREATAGGYVASRAAAIAEGARTLRADGRADCAGLAD